MTETSATPATENTLHVPLQHFPHGKDETWRVVGWGLGSLAFIALIGGTMLVGLNAAGVLKGTDYEARLAIAENQIRDHEDQGERIAALEKQIAVIQATLEKNTREMAVHRAVSITMFGDETTNALLNEYLPPKPTVEPAVTAEGDKAATAEGAKRK